MRRVRSGCSGVTSLRELIYGELFVDLLEMLEQLLSEGYKDAAAVIAGSSLEGHLKQLWAKHEISLNPTTSGGPSPKTAGVVNSDLRTASGCSSIDRKNVTAWLGLRNAAAHGDYFTFTADQVRNLIIGVQNFIKKVPAWMVLCTRCRTSPCSRPFNSAASRRYCPAADGQR